MAYGTIINIDGLIKAKFYWAISTAEEIERNNLPWCLFNNYPLVDSTKYAQVRPIESLAPLAEISEYAQMMRNGDQFPPVIVTADGYLVDGHTRTEAARRNGYDEFPAMVLTTVNLGDLSTTSPFYDQVMTLGTAQNKKHGRRMSNAEVARIIERISPRTTVPEIIHNFRVSKSFATMVWNAARTKRKVAELDIEFRNSFSMSQLKLFGGKIDKYTDPVWGAVFSLAQDAHMKVVASNALMKGVEEFHDEPARLAFIDQERARLNPVIKTGGYTPLTKSRRVKQALGAIRKNTPESMIEKDSDLTIRNEYLTWLMESDELIRKAISLQEEWNANVLGR